MIHHGDISSGRWLSKPSVCSTAVPTSPSHIATLMRDADFNQYCLNIANNGRLQKY